MVSEKRDFQLKTTSLGYLMRHFAVFCRHVSCEQHERRGGQLCHSPMPLQWEIQAFKFSIWSEFYYHVSLRFRHETSTDRISVNFRNMAVGWKSLISTEYKWKINIYWLSCVWLPTEKVRRNGVGAETRDRAGRPAPWEATRTPQWPSEMTELGLSL